METARLIMRMTIRHILAASILFAALPAAPGAAADTAGLLQRFASYQQGEPLAHLIEARRGVFAGTGDETVRAARERELLKFITSDAHPQAKAFAIEWLGCLGTAASVSTLAAALEQPDLAGPARGALGRIPGPEAERALAANPMPPPTVATVAAEVARFHAALDDGDADNLIAEALAATNELLAGAALRRLRAGDGSTAITGQLLADLNRIPAARHAALFEALATRPDAAATLHPLLTERVQDGDLPERAAALITLGRIMRADDIAMVLGWAVDPATPDLATAATVALSHATEPGIDAALAAHAAAGGARSIAAINALALRHHLDSVDLLWDLAASPDGATAVAAWKALGSLIPPSDLADVIGRLAAAQDTAVAEPVAEVLWQVLRRHPDRAAAAAFLEQQAAAASDALKETLLQQAARIRQ